MASVIATSNGNVDAPKGREKVIIDTDPGIDDSMAIFMAFQSPQLEVLGLTTIFGNVSTEGGTHNALLLCEIAGCPGLPVAEGSPEPLKGGKPQICDFIHGSDGLGNVFLPSPKSKKIEKTASEFLVDMVSENPGEVSILALGPLTNLALAIKRDSTFASKVKRVVVLGGSFFALGNINPAAEANVSTSSAFLYSLQSDAEHATLIYGDPEAADIVFTSGADIVVVGINITTQIKMGDADLEELRQSKGRHAQVLSKMCKFYRDWHVKSDGVYGKLINDLTLLFSSWTKHLGPVGSTTDSILQIELFICSSVRVDHPYKDPGIFPHDAVSLVALVRPDLFTYKRGVVRVETQGICLGHTLMDQGLKIWNSSNPWTGYFPVSVAWTVNVEEVLNYIKKVLMKP
ncbi:hypothetical protein RHSIM_Rhsim03G0077300 [Rhododendron simsii]|uniref:Inosine/uridine-preferring nucleoside hydrolase domain-containing protein n=1 Tax=Rhododendron simsii TaxID=118357 RepID=A0A834H943_RHOSS|nr:hypothetical protein RHSIM_Rhsim03G0077300 [Rhododendron simsii]